MTQEPGAFGRAEPPAITYSAYLGIRELLSLQRPLSSPPDRDELLFIIVHQVHELWFKLALWELDHARVAMERDQPRQARRHVERVTAIQRATRDAIHILETMSSSDFLRFRDHLKPASGFQSAQFRELEALCGLAETGPLAALDTEPTGLANVKRRRQEPSLEESFYALLRRRGFDLPRRDQGLDEAARQSRVVAALLPIFKDQDRHEQLFDLAEALIGFDEGLTLWRQHHVQMAERMIGHKIGTGGSAGVGYLRTTLDLRAFPDLWALRTELEPEPYGGP